jgi:hypothetical protein
MEKCLERKKSGCCSSRSRCLKPSVNEDVMAKNGFVEIEARKMENLA